MNNIFHLTIHQWLVSTFPFQESRNSSLEWNSFSIFFKAKCWDVSCQSYLHRNVKHPLGLPSMINQIYQSSGEGESGLMADGLKHFLSISSNYDNGQSERKICRTIQQCATIPTASLTTRNRGLNFLFIRCVEFIHELLRNCDGTSTSKIAVNTVR